MGHHLDLLHDTKLAQYGEYREKLTSIQINAVIAVVWTATMSVLYGFFLFAGRN